MYLRMMVDHVVYILKCVAGKFYVGRCNARNLRGRLYDHRNGRGCAFTRAFPAIHIVRAYRSNHPLDEDFEVLSMMSSHGIDNVRGGTFSNPGFLCNRHRLTLVDMLRHMHGACMACGLQGHFVRECWYAWAHRTDSSSTNRPNQPL